MDNEGNNNPCPCEWDGIIVTANCDEATEICKINIYYNVAIQMETVIWKKEEMCPEKNAYDNKPLMIRIIVQKVNVIAIAFWKP